jgi:hypothetical protein
MRIQANRRTRRLSILFTGLLVSLPAVAQTDRTFVT